LVTRDTPYIVLVDSLIVLIKALPLALHRRSTAESYFDAIQHRSSAKR
jgi:hypothetical protein